MESYIVYPLENPVREREETYPSHYSTMLTKYLTMTA